MTEPSTETWPAGLYEAFTGYEAALASDDADALADAFEPGEDVLRVDGAGILAGADEIARFRSARGGITSRTISRAEVRPLSDDTVLVASESNFTRGGRGYQTQVWRRSADGKWRIAAAHVTPRPRPLVTSIWRAVGAPLLPATGSGPLDGLTVAVKDIFAVGGFPTGCGIPAMVGEAKPADSDADALAQLRAAGAAVAGIAQTDEFAYSIAGTNAHYGTPPNPAAPGHLPGGSSSGPASAVALGQADIGLATDTAGSVRVPASYQGLWGLRTTHGAVSRAGLSPLAPAFDVVGWITRTPEILRAVAAVGLPDLTSRSAATAVAVPADLARWVEPGTMAAFEAFLEGLRTAGVISEVRSVEIPDPDLIRETFRVVQGGQAWREHGDWITAHPSALGADIAGRFAMARDLSTAAIDLAADDFDRLRPRLRDLVVDAPLVLPSCPGPAPRIGEVGPQTRTSTLALTTIASVGGLPAISAPLLEVDALPVGLGVIGAVDDDLTLIDLAASWAAASTTTITASPAPQSDR